MINVKQFIISLYPVGEDMKKSCKSSLFRKVIDWLDRNSKREFSKIVKPRCSSHNITVILKEHDKITLHLNTIIHNYVKKNRIGYVELANQIGISHTTLRTYMNESRNPHPKTLFKIQQFFRDKE